MENNFGHNQEKLIGHILLLSEAETFEEAKEEWDLTHISIKDGKCPCGIEIRDHCHLKNRLNGNVTHVGNVCVNRFLGVETGNLFDGFKRILADKKANANDDLIQYAYDAGFIYESELKFLTETKRKRKLSAKQLAWKQKINERILAGKKVR